jgi:hypothetical protein
MKMTPLVLLGVCTLCLTQYAFCANVRSEPHAYAHATAYRSAAAAYAPPPYYGRPAYQSSPQWQRQMPSQSRYRFRPWSGDRRWGEPSVSRVNAPVAPANRSVSYWGGVPAARAQFVNRPEDGKRQTGRMRPAYRPWMTPVPGRPANPYQAQHYRFRPMEGARFGHDDGQPRYRSLQVQIPERYVFRPLNPMRRSTAPITVSHQPYRAPYPYMPYPNAGYRPVYPYPVQPLPMHRYAYGGYPAAGGLYGAAPAIPVPGWRVPYVSAMPPYYAQGMSSPNRLRPLPEPLPSSTARRHGYYGPAYREMAPPPRYTYESPNWGNQRYRPWSWTGGQPAAGQTASRPVQPHAKLNRYGTDWYDGRGDGEGAWYQLTEESSPAVTQQWGDDGSILPEGETY